MMLLGSIFAWCMAGPLKCDLDKGAQHEQLQANVLQYKPICDSQTTTLMNENMVPTTLHSL
jgi:hypothetical protein